MKPLRDEAACGGHGWGSGIGVSINALPNDSPAVAKQLPSSCQAVAKQLPSSCQAMVKRLLNSRFASVECSARV